MGLTVPKVLFNILAEADSSALPIDVMGLAGKLSTAIKEPKALTIEERRGAFAEIEALRFQRPHGTERRPWGIYWSDLSSGTTSTGAEFHSPDIADVDVEILAHWISRSEQAKHPVLRARFSDLAWEIGRYLKLQPKVDDAQAKAPISIDIPFHLTHRAIDAYLETIETELYEDEYDAWQFLDRAIGLAISINDSIRIKKAKIALFAFYRLKAADGKFMWGRFDHLTWEYAKALDLDTGEKQEIIDALERVLAISSDISRPQRFDPHDATAAADGLARRRAQTNEPGEARRAMQTAALAFEEVARIATRLTAIAWLEDLIPRYRNLGMTEDAVRIEQTIRRRAQEAQGEMKHIEIPFTIPKEELDAWTEQLSGNSLGEGLSRIAFACLIKESSTEKSLRSMSENAPLFALMPSAVMGSDGFTTAKVGSINDDMEGRAIQHAATLFRTYP